MLKLDAHTTALVLIDLQNGILPFAGGPHSAESVVANGAQLAAHFRSLGAPVILVRVGWSDSFAEALKQPVDKPSPAPASGLPANWWEFPESLAVSDRDILVTKRQWGAGRYLHQYWRGIYGSRGLGTRLRVSDSRRSLQCAKC